MLIATKLSGVRKTSLDKLTFCSHAFAILSYLYSSIRYFLLRMQLRYNGTQHTRNPRIIVGATDVVYYIRKFIQ